VFDNPFYQTVPDRDADPEPLKLSTDCTLSDAAGFLPLAEQFRDSNDAFFAAYAKAHKKLSELGAKFE
jgi:L-ascorbate peroxidase